MELKNYQEEAIKDLLSTSMKHIHKHNRKRIILKSPTGSGKTIIAAEFLKRLSEKDQLKDNISFIWIAPNELHTQSKDKLSNYYKDSRGLDCIGFDDLSDCLESDQILFLNWESINSTENIYIKDNERNRNLKSIMNKTQNEARKIVLIIDENHRNARTEKSKKVINIINPHIIIGVSATPKIKDDDEKVLVEPDDVKKEEMIKKSFIINQDLKTKKDKLTLDIDFSDINKEEFILKEALKKRKELLEAYKRNNTDVNPLLLIQIPNDTQTESNIKDEIICILDEEGINISNKKLAIWLSNEKQNLENIKDKNNKTEVLIFKQAISLGWDCPRSQVLVLYRDWKNEDFSIQTLGRIMRMPEVKYYDSNFEILNHAYVFTAISKINIPDSNIKQHLGYKGSRKDSYKDINLASYHQKRKRDKTRLSPEFINIFIEQSEKLDINIDDTEVQHDVFLNYEEENIDKIKSISGSGKYDVNNIGDLQEAFNSFIVETLQLEPYIYPEGQSVSRLKDSIYIYFDKKNKLNYEKVENLKRIFQLVLSGNKTEFQKIITFSKEEYLKEITREQNEYVENKHWNVPECFIFYNEEEEEMGVKKSIIHPFHKPKSQPEQNFIKYLEKSTNVIWWFKNGDHGEQFFAIPYSKNDTKHLFYVDFIVQLSNGSIGLFDTKSGYTLEGAEFKVKGLKNYLNEHQKVFKNSGVVFKKGDIWKVYKEKDQPYDPKNPRNYEDLTV